MFTVARARQNGSHHRAELNKKVCRIGSSDDEKNATTEHVMTPTGTVKSITPMGGFPHYGIFKNGYLMPKGSILTPKNALLRCARVLWVHNL
jgi:large subunit ribosomal protein L3e